MASKDNDEAGLVLIVPVAAAIQVLLLVRNALFLPPPANRVMPVIQAAIVIGLLWLWRWLNRQSSPGLELQRMLPWLLIAVGLLLPFEQALTGNGMLAANLALVLVVGGALIVGRTHFITVSAVLGAGWLVAVMTRRNWNVSAADQAIYVGLGIAIGLAVYLLRTADRRRLEAARDDAYLTATRDHLTSLWNRRGIVAILPSMVGTARENHTGIWCVFIDVRGLKKVNDSSGHAAGDRLLSAVGRALEATETFGGVPARWGGDEFCVFGVGSSPDVDGVHAQLVGLVREQVHATEHWDLSLGVACDVEPGGDFLDHLVRLADEDMYRRRRAVQT